MTSVQLATMSTGLWLVATVALFILLAAWSSGESWGVTASIVRGVRGWADHDGPGPAVTSPFTEPPPALLLIPNRPIGGVAARRLPTTAGSTATGPSPTVATPVGWHPAVGPDSIAEIVDLGEHRLPR